MNKILETEHEIKPGLTIGENLKEMLLTRKALLIVIHKSNTRKHILTITQSIYSWTIFEGLTADWTKELMLILDVKYPEEFSKFSYTYLEI